MQLLTQLFSLLLSFFLTFLSGAPFLTPENGEATQQDSLPLTDISENPEPTLEEVFGDIDLKLLAEVLETPEYKGALDFFPINLITEHHQHFIGTYFGSIFSMKDGLDAAPVFGIQAVIAPVMQALHLLPLYNEELKIEVSRHFLWSYYATKYFGSEVSRIHLSNYELGGIAARPAMNFIEERYAQLVAQGKSPSEARVITFIDCHEFAFENREQVFRDAHSFETWNAHYTNADIMDLWNNNAGRQAALDARFTDPMTPFHAAFDEGTLIKDSNNDEVTLEKRQFIYENASLWNPLVKP